MHSLLYSDADGIPEIRLNRPSRSNAVDTQLLDELVEVMSGDLGPCALLTAAGDGAFCGGADITLDDDARARLSDRLYELYAAMVASPTILICVLDGAAVGAGAQLAVACDLRVAGSRASLRFAGPGHGLAVGTWALPSLVGRGGALDLCLTMRAVDAAQAHRMGVIDHLVDAPMEHAVTLARQIAELDDQARARVKRLVGESAGVEEALARERRANKGWDGSLATSQGRRAHHDRAPEATS